MSRSNLYGLQFGRLVIQDYYGEGKWICKCSHDGNICIVSTQNLKNGNTKSCGCLKKEFAWKERLWENNRTHGMYRSPIYHIWQAMKDRCINPNNPEFHNYGGRGILVCQEWMESFLDFYRDMGERPEKTEIERRDNNLGYCPSNCYWATRVAQSNNMRKNVFLTFNDETKTISQWARETGISPQRIGQRIKKGWSIENALTIPTTKKVVR